MTHRWIAPALLVAAVVSLGACGSAEKTGASGPSVTGQTTEAASGAGGLSGEEFIRTADSLAGGTVTLGRCSLLTTPISDGTLPCRVLDTGGIDIKDANGLPVDIFIKQADLSPEAQAVVATCGGVCTVQISGRLDRAADGTGYLSMSDVTLTAAG